MTLWEMWSNGEKPWADFGPKEILEAIEKGERPKKPENAGKNVCGIMRFCWTLNPEGRPSFALLSQLLSSIKFEIVETKTGFSPRNPNQVKIKSEEKFVILEKANPSSVFGQNLITRKYGLVPKSVLKMNNNVRNEQPPIPQHGTLPIKPDNTSEATTKPKIELVPGSFIHLKHMDADDALKICNLFVNESCGSEPKKIVHVAPQPSPKANPSPINLPGAIPTPASKEELLSSRIFQERSLLAAEDNELEGALKIENSNENLESKVLLNFENSNDLTESLESLEEELSKASLLLQHVLDAPLFQEIFEDDSTEEDAQIQRENIDNLSWLIFFIIIQCKFLAKEEKEKLLAEVISKVPSDMKPETCEKFLEKYDYDVELAVQELKVQKLSSLSYVCHEDLARLALQISNWDVVTAAKLLAS
uniref:Serine-threonine/tyrosine-protein kinase catalytic domain-containing protein n=1 Tax=Panagrolaimus sp. JU765 TaxID=591449 RepID=A0AC34RG44_9BILA